MPLPKNESEYGQLLLVYEISLMAGQSSAEFISTDRTQTLISVFTEDLTNHNLLAFAKEIENWWAQKGLDLEVSISGRDTLFSEIAEETVYKSMMGASIAAVLITLFLIFSFKSIKWGLFSMIPNMLPFVLLFGIWGISFGELNQATCMAFTMMLGIVVDDTIHFIIRFRDAKQNMTLEESITQTFNFVGFAISATTVIFMVVGLVTAVASQFIPNSIVGVIMFLVIFLAWLFDLFLLPALLTIYYRRKELPLSKSSVSSQNAA